MKERKLLLHEQMEEHGEQVEEIELLKFRLDKLQFYKKNTCKGQMFNSYRFHSYRSRCSSSKHQLTTTGIK